MPADDGSLHGILLALSPMSPHSLIRTRTQGLGGAVRILRHPKRSRTYIHTPYNWLESPLQFPIKLHQFHTSRGVFHLRLADYTSFARIGFSPSQHVPPHGPHVKALLQLTPPFLDLLARHTFKPYSDTPGFTTSFPRSRRGSTAPV